MKDNLKKSLLLFFIGFIIYFPSLFFNFSYFDDLVLILENLNFLKNGNNFLKVFNTDVFQSQNVFRSYYRPVLTLSFMIDAQLSSDRPFFYHFSNIIYHLIAVILIFIFLKKLRIDEKIAFYLSLIFAVHPVLTQAVSWIPGRNDSLLTIFILSSFIFLINYLEKRNFFDFVFYCLFFSLALFTKESALLFPFFTIIFITFFYREKKFFLTEIFFSWWFIIFFWLILRQKALNNVLYLNPSDILKALIFNSPALIQYFGKIFFPFNLSVLPTIKDTTFIWGFLAVFVFILIIIFGQKIEKKKFFFGIFWFTFFLVPNFIRPNPSIMADFLEHRIYLPLVGFLLAVVSVEKIKHFLINDKNKILIYGLIVIFSFITFFHQFRFKNRLVFWENAVKSSPHSPLAHRNYGAMLYFENRLEEAEKHYRESLKLNPQEPMAHNNIGVIYSRKKKWQKAIKEFKEELEINPNYDNALYNLGLAYYNLGEKEKARDFWEKTIQINPKYISAYKNLAGYYQEKKEKEIAEKYLMIYYQLGGD